MPGDTNCAQSGFTTELDAWQFIFSKMCKGCRIERQRVLEGKGDPYEDSEYPACSAQWEVILTDESKHKSDNI